MAGLGRNTVKSQRILTSHSIYTTATAITITFATTTTTTPREESVVVHWASGNDPNNLI